MRKPILCDVPESNDFGTATQNGKFLRRRRNQRQHTEKPVFKEHLLPASSTALKNQLFGSFHVPIWVNASRMGDAEIFITPLNGLYIAMMMKTAADTVRAQVTIDGGFLGALPDHPPDDLFANA